MKPKEFQLRSADWICHRMFNKEEGQTRLLLADEVGLGKTVVAAEVVRRLQKRLGGRRDAFILYVCSNGDLARQNARRLGGKEFPARRLGVLPATQRTQGGEPQIAGVTSGTSFLVGPREGDKEERAVLLLICQDALGLELTEPIGELFRCRAGRAGFQRQYDSVRRRYVQVDNRKLIKDFARRMRNCAVSAATLLRDGLAVMTQPRKAGRTLQQELFGLMRRELIKSVLVSGPRSDLIILDEFQRFDDIITEAKAEGTIAYEVFGRGQAPVLLLSATPFKMYTHDWESGEPHYQQFYKVLEFLLERDPHARERLERIRDLLERYSDLILEVARGEGRPEAALAVKESLAGELRRVMARTERRVLGASLQPHGIPLDGVLSGVDIQQYMFLRQAAGPAHKAAVMAYWQSSPYLLSFFDRQYQLKRHLTGAAAGKLRLLTKRRLLPLRKNAVLDSATLQAGRKLEITHLRMRRLHDLTVGRQMHRWIWLPPAKPYWRPEGEFAGGVIQEPSKYLVFSNWRAVPRAISAILSYEVERDLLGSDKRHGRGDGHALPLTAKGASSHFLLLYPSCFLAETIDPVQLLRGWKKEAMPTWRELRRRAIQRLTAELTGLGIRIRKQGGAGAAHLWKTLVSLDARKGRWELYEALAGMTAPPPNRDEEKESDEPRVLNESVRLREWQGRLRSQCLSGELPRAIARETVELLVDVALAAPATTLMRAALRQFAEVPWAVVQREIMSVSIRGLRRLFGGWAAHRTVSAGKTGQHYWRQVLEYGYAGNLPAVWDEYMHLLAEGERNESRLSLTARTLHLVLGSVRGRLKVDVFDPKEPSLFRPAPWWVHFAVPFTDDQDEKQERHKEKVRHAFNSPFWPFVLVTTSVGQEGLDFHRYCREIVHWNLPTNPVDFEQREGRINRFRCLAVRQAVGREFSWQGALGSIHSHPWDALFDKAAELRPSEIHDLWPDWVFQGKTGGLKLVRHLWFFPFSREYARFRALQDAIVLYRLAFGQPNQTDFLLAITRRAGESGVNLTDLVGQYAIDLRPVSEPSVAD